MEKITLKKIITQSNKNLMIAILVGFFLAFYTASGAISYQTGVELIMPKWEQNIPFLTWTIWIYIVLYPLYLIWSVFSYKDIEEINKISYGIVMLTVISCSIFIIFPVVYPRGFFPLSLDNDITTLIFRGMRRLDKPSNCLPSLHVGLCYVFCFGHLKESKWKFYLSFFLSTLISISTLTTKQHYAYDIALGFLLALGIYLFFSRFVQISKK